MCIKYTYIYIYKIYYCFGLRKPGRYTFDAGLLEFGLIMQIREGIDAIYGQNSK